MQRQTRKIGLYLGAAPESGGTYQYNRSMLEAVASLPRDEYRAVVAHTSPAWLPLLDDHQLAGTLVRRSLLDRLVGGTYHRLGLPVAAWRTVAPCLDGFTRRLLDERCDLWVFPSQDSWSYRIPVPALCTVHDLMHRHERRFPEVSAAGEYRRRETEYRNISRWSRGLLVDSELGKRQLHEAYGPALEKIFVLPYVPPRYLYSESAAASPKTNYSLPRKYIFYPAQFWKHKNHEALVRAAAELAPEFPDVHLVFAGSRKNAYDAVRHLVSVLNLDDKVTFLGYVPDDDMPALYRRARALMMPTYFGPTNIPPLEAFALGCPVAASNVYAMPEQLGDAALLFDPSVIGEVREVMKRLWRDDDLCKDLSAKGYRRAREWNQSHFDARLRVILSQTLNPGFSPGFEARRRRSR